MVIYILLILGEELVILCLCIDIKNCISIFIVVLGERINVLLCFCLNF